MSALSNKLDTQSYEVLNILINYDLVIVYTTL